MVIETYLGLKKNDILVYKSDYHLGKYENGTFFIFDSFYHLEHGDKYGAKLLKIEDGKVNEGDKHEYCKELVLDNFELFAKGTDQEKPIKLKAAVEQVTSWKRALNAARRTIGKKNLNKEPSDSWKAQAILAEHSPIRTVIFNWSWENIRQWVTTHLVRHHAGVEKFVHSQREDRRDLGIPRDELPQGALNDMEMEGNIQAMINISRKRVCNNASKETREAWKAVLDEVEKIDPILGEKLKLGRECVYRGFCPEFKCCGYCNTEQYQKDLIKYRNRKYDKECK